MYFGKAHLYFLREEYTKQADVIKNVLTLNKKYKDSWLWTNNETVKSANVGFSQGGQTAMHAQKLVDTTSYGYLVKITKTFAGGGCYDLKITVDKSLDSGNSIYNPPKMPAVIWLGLETVRKLSGSD